MEESKLKSRILKILVCACVACAFFAILFSTRTSYSATVSVIVPTGAETEVYVGGDGVKKNEDGSYVVPANGKITVTVVNEKKLFKSMTISGEGGTNATTSEVPVIRNFTVPASGEISIEVETTEPYAEDKGSYFGNPYLISKEADVLALARILRGVGTASDFGRFGAENGDIESLRYGYFRLTTNVFINNSEFYGLGTRSSGGVPFQGCFDFAGYAATIGITRTAHAYEEFNFVGEEDIYIADYGFFSMIYGADDKPCLVRNAMVQGYIAVNTMATDTAVTDKTRINAGGLAGTAGKNIVFDGIESQVSVSARVQNASLYIGGVFGVCSSDVEKWCDAVYDGEHNNVSGVTYGEKASVYAGCFCGVLQNAYADGVVIEGEAAMVLANSLGDIAGSAVSGGFAGVVVVRESPLPEFSEVRSIFIRDVDIVVQGEYNVQSVIANDASEEKADIDPEKLDVYSASAVSGGFCGTIYRQSNLSDSSVGISVAGIRFAKSADRDEESGGIRIRAQSQDGLSSGSVFAGGAIGYVYTDGIKYITHGFNEENLSDERGRYIFECSADISAVQNGVGPAYAGGVFGYNCFMLTTDGKETVKFHITAHEYDFSVTAVQSASSSAAKKSSGTTAVGVPYSVCAGGYTSVLPCGYEVNNVEFSVKNGEIRAYREVGSTAIGEICAGGYAGMAISYTGLLQNVRSFNETFAGKIKDLKVTYSSQSLVEAACYSFDSIDDRGRGIGGNNVCAGGAIGFAAGLNEISGLTVEWNKKNNLSGDSEFFVYGVQNGGFPSGDNNDLKCEGYVGGAIGLTIDVQCTSLNVSGNSETKSVVYFESANNPDTASVGGLIGAIWRWRTQTKTLLGGGSVSDMHVAGKAYSNAQTGDIRYDIYVGGATGVFANPSVSGKNGSAYIKNISVKDCIVESIGEDKMATYAAGIVAGIWWASTGYLQNSTVTNSSVTASSVSGKTYAGGVAGLVQRATVEGCAAISTDVRSVSVNEEASAAGVFAWAKEGWTVRKNVSDATVHASGGKGSWTGGIGHPPSGKPNGNISMTENYDVSENAGTDLVYRNASNYSGLTSGAALHLVSYGENAKSISKGESFTAYPEITSADSIISVKSSDEKIASVTTDANGVKVTGVSAGVAYISVYATVGGKEYRLCSYPVTVENPAAQNFSLKVTGEDGKELTSENTDGYAVVHKGTSANYVYFRHEAGNEKTVDFIRVLPQGMNYFPVKAVLYDVSLAADSSMSDSERALAIIAAKPSSVAQISTFNGRATITAEGTDGVQNVCRIQSTATLKEPTIIVMEFIYGGITHGVIAEFVPNEITSLTITPDEGTPPIYSYIAEDGYRHYVYVKGDTVRFSEKIEYKYQTKRSYIVETSYSGTNVATNGTVVLSSYNDYVVTCTVLGKNVSDTVVLEVKDETRFDFELSGADVSSDRKMIEDSSFGFTSSAQPGYGLKPALSLKIGETTVNGTWKDDTVEAVYKGVKYVISAKANAYLSYSYDFVLPEKLVTEINGDGVTICVTYAKTYSLVFLTNFGSYDFFKTIVPADATYASLDIEGLNEWIKSVAASRYGFDFVGFYQVLSATELAAYGKSFEELKEDSSAIVNGSLRFYARWTYNVSVEAPEGAEVKSSFPATSLQDGYIVPADDKNGFGFSISVSDSWKGEPRFNAFVRLSDGTYADITAEFTDGAEKYSYEISAESLGAYDSGYIYLVVYADSLEFYTGDAVRHEETELYSDGEFTAVYNVNYGENDETGAITFDFGEIKLPENTSLRLFYRKNSVTVWSGGYVLSEKTSEIPISAFASLKDGSAITDEVRAGATAEEFILVVTLPINTDGFGITESGLKASVSVNAYKFAFDKKNYGSAAEKTDAADKPLESYAAPQKDFTLYKADIYTVKKNGTGTLAVSHSGLKDGLVDRRRGGDVYIWKIEPTAGGAIGEADFSSFGITETVRTTTAAYFFAQAGENAYTYDLSGYTVSLVEVKNAQQPAHGHTLYSFVIE